jgi:hypothetical protein
MRVLDSIKYVVNKGIATAAAPERQCSAKLN